MWIRPQDVEDDDKFRRVIQSLLRVHGFSWYNRNRVRACDDIYTVRFRGCAIHVHHLAMSPIVKSLARWTRIHIPADLENDNIFVHIDEWPPSEIRIPNDSDEDDDI